MSLLTVAEYGLGYTCLSFMTALFIGRALSRLDTAPVSFEMPEMLETTAFSARDNLATG